MAEGQTRKKVVYTVLDGGISDVLPYGSQSPQAQGLPPYRDAQNVIYSLGSLKPGWRWIALDASTHVNPTISGNVASRQETNLTNAQYVVDALFITSGSENQQAYIILTDGEIFVNGVPVNPTYNYGEITIPGAFYDVDGSNVIAPGTASIGLTATITSAVVA